MLGALHPASRGLELGLFNRVVGNDDLQKATDELVELLLLKNQQGLRQLKFMINRGVEADLYTAQGFEVLGAGLTGALLMGGGLADSDSAHGWPAYRTGSDGDSIRRRRAASKDFWT
jgi:enoyl-CoA hydratase